MNKRHVMTARRKLVAFALLAFLGACSPSCAPRPETSVLLWQLAYNDDGRVQRLTSPSGVQTSFTYEFHDDGLSVRRLVRTTGAEPSVSLEFDTTGLRRHMTDSAGSVTYEYDRSDHLTNVCRESMPCITYEYDEVERLGSVELSRKSAGSSLPSSVCRGGKLTDSRGCSPDQTGL